MANQQAAAPLKILCLHGYTQSGPQFSSKTGALRKALSAALRPRPVEFSYPSAPLRLRAQDIPGYEPVVSDTGMETGVEDIEESVEAFGWWRRRDQKRGEDGDGDEDEVVYAGLEEGLDVIAACVLREGPFDGVLGFSQGACAAGMVAALLDSRSARRREGFAQIYAGRRSRGDGFEYPSSFLTSDGQPIQGPLRFAVMYSGFVAPGSRYAPFWTPKIEIASLHVLGGLDTVVSEERSSALMDAFDEDGKVVVRHPGGHFVPSGKVWLNAVVRFIGDVVKGAT